MRLQGMGGASLHPAPGPMKRRQLASSAGSQRLACSRRSARHASRPHAPSPALHQCTGFFPQTHWGSQAMRLHGASSRGEGRGSQFGAVLQQAALAAAAVGARIGLQAALRAVQGLAAPAQCPGVLMSAAALQAHA
jgi:hypothetical protein